jgi:AraC-like DNA-binding protein
MLASVTDAPVPRALPLERFVEGAWALAPVDGRVRHGWLPDGRTSLVFRVLEEGRGDVSLAGPRTHARVKDVRGVVRAVVVRFKPGWTVPLFDVAASELTNRIVPLDVVWGREGADVYERLRETRDVTELVEGLSRVFTRRMRAFESSSAHLARRAARLFDAGQARIDGVAAQLGVTDRHLRRAFTEHVGVSPKDYVRSVRLLRAVSLTTASNDWGRIALDAGYYDQAHFIGDFRRLMGVTPGAFVRGERDVVLPCGYQPG